MTDDERERLDLETIRQAVRETVNGRLDRMAKTWDKEHQLHQDHCRREREVLHEKVDRGDVAFTEFLTNEWQPVKKAVLDTMAFLRLSAKLLSGFVALSAVVFGVLAAVGVI